MQKRLNWSKKDGFSLIELLVAIAIFLVIVSFVFKEFTQAITLSRRERGLVDRNAQLRRAMELMSSELSHAGVTPEFTTDPTDPDSMSPTISFSNTNFIGVTGTGAGLYPGRPITLTLPTSAVNSETLTIQTISSSGCGSSPKCMTLTSNPLNAHNTGDSISSSMLPNMFGILNPPPLTAGTPPALPLTSTTKQVNTIGFIGDIYGDGVLNYIEYSYNSTTQTLTRSQTPISQGTKNSSSILLDFVQQQKDSSNNSLPIFTIIYPNSSTPVPVAVQIQFTLLSSAPDIANGENNAAPAPLKIDANTKVEPRGVYSAATIFALNGGEMNLRSVLPPCRTTGASPQNRYPPCDSWSSSASPVWAWWSNLYSFSSSLP